MELVLEHTQQGTSNEVSETTVTTYAVRITWLIADIEDKYHGPSKYGDSDGGTLDDPILILEILSRRFFLRGIYLITGSRKDGDGDTSFQQSQVHCHMLILKTQ
ncbi:hypothetical protein Tco_0180803 [Tanacetum coccineum]